MRILSKILVVLLILLGGGYSTLWYVNGQANLRQVEKALSDVANNPFIEAVSYDSLKLGGFPMHVDVLVQNPKYTMVLDLSKLMKEFPVLDGSTSWAPIRITSSSEKDFIVRGNVIGSSYKLITQMPGKVTYDTPSFEETFLQSGDELVLAFNMDAKDTFSQAQNLESLFEMTLKEWATSLLKSASLSSKNLVITDKNGEELSTSDASSIGGGMELVDEATGTYAINFNYLLKNAFISEAYEEVLERLFQDVGLGKDLELRMADHGVHSANGEFRYEGPIQLEDFLSGKFKVDSDFKGDFSSQMVTYDYLGDIFVHLQDNLENSHLRLNTSLLFGEQAQGKLEARYRKVLERAQAELETDEEKQALQFFIDRVDRLIPNLQELGKMKIGFNVAATSQNVLYLSTLEDISYVNDKHGVVLEGQIKASPLTASVNGDLKLRLNNVNDMLTRLQSYFELMIEFQEEQGVILNPLLTKDLSERLEKILRELARGSSDNDLVFKILVEAKEPFYRINNIPSEEVMAIVNKHLMPAPEEEIVNGDSSASISPQVVDDMSVPVTTPEPSFDATSDDIVSDEEQRFENLDDQMMDDE